MKRRNPRFGCRWIAQQLSFLFGLEIDKGVVRRVLAKHHRPTHDSDGPSWLTFLGHAKDSLWSVDLFRCESLIIKTGQDRGPAGRDLERVVANLQESPLCSDDFAQDFRMPRDDLQKRLCSPRRMATPLLPLLEGSRRDLESGRELSLR